MTLALFKNGPRRVLWSKTPLQIEIRFKKNELSCLARHFSRVENNIVRFFFFRINNFDLLSRPKPLISFVRVFPHLRPPGEGMYV